MHQIGLSGAPPNAAPSAVRWEAVDGPAGALSHLARRGAIAASYRPPNPLNPLNPSPSVGQVMSSKKRLDVTMPRREPVGWLASEKLTRLKHGVRQFLKFNEPNCRHFFRSPSADPPC
jgi:hypothetical protein